MRYDIHGARAHCRQLSQRGSTKVIQARSPEMWCDQQTGSVRAPNIPHRLREICRLGVPQI